MQRLLASKTVSMTELRDPAKALAEAGGRPVAILNRSKVVGYLVPEAAINAEEVEYASTEEVMAVMAESRAEIQHVLDYLRDK